MAEVALLLHCVWW